MILEEDKKRSQISYILALIVLAVYPFRHICFGTDWWDTGYNYGNFVFMKQMDPMWISGTFLGTALGNLMTRLPFGGTMVGLNFYTSIILALLGAGGLWFGVKKMHIPVRYAFLGELLAEFFSWCPTALLYNYLTYLLLFAGCACLYLGLTKRGEGEGKFFVFAGIFLGINVLTRFPNLSEMGMIVAVWAMAILEKKGWATVFRQTGLCIAGYCLGILSGFGFVALSLGLSTYVGGIQRLLSMPGEATDYSLYSMIYSQIEAYKQGMIKGIYLFLLILFMVVFGLICRKLFPEKVRMHRGVLGMAAAIGCGLCIWLYYQKGWFSFDYYGKDSYFLFATFFLLFYILTSVYGIFSKRFSMDEKLVLGMGVLLCFITPLGSNNHLYSATNNIFLMAPLCIFMIARFFKYCKENSWLSGVGTVLVLFMGMLIVQSGIFSATNVFCEAYGGKNLHTKIVNNDILKGMKTSPDRAKEIENLTSFVQEEGLKEKELLLYGGIPSMAYYLDMPFVFTAWPDLRSYNREVLVQNLKELEQQVAAGEKELPILLLGNPQGTVLNQEDAEIADEKLLILQRFAVRNHYIVKYESEKFVLMIPQE